QGRSFWVLDDLTVLHQLKVDQAATPLHVYTPKTAIRMGGGHTDTPPRMAGQNPPNGAVIRFHLKDAPAEGTPLNLDILDPAGKVVRRFSTHPKGKDGKEKPEQLNAAAGLNQFVWDLRYPRAEGFPGMVLWGGLPAPKAVPGTYQARFQL